MVVAHHIGEELQEEGEQEEANVHAVDVGVGRDDDFIITQSIQAFLDIERRLEEMKFFVLVDNFLRETVSIKWFALQGEDGLGLDVARRGQGAGRRIALNDK